MRILANFLSGAILGASIGAAAAMLLAPKRGDDFRADIRKELDVILEEGRKAAREKEEEMRQQLAVMRGVK